MNKKFILIFILILYLGINIYAFLISNSKAFFPPNNTYEDTSDIIKLQTSNGEIISAIYLPNEKAKYMTLPPGIIDMTWEKDYMGVLLIGSS